MKLSPMAVVLRSVNAAALRSDPDAKIAGYYMKNIKHLAIWIAQSGYAGKEYEIVSAEMDGAIQTKVLVDGLNVSETGGRTAYLALS